MGLSGVSRDLHLLLGLMAAFIGSAADAVLVELSTLDPTCEGALEVGDGLDAARLQVPGTYDLRESFLSSVAHGHEKCWGWSSEAQRGSARFEVAFVPLTVAHGTLSAPGPASLEGTELAVRAEPHDVHRREALVGERWSAGCVVEAGEFSCRLPADVLRAQFDLDGFAPSFVDPLDASSIASSPRLALAFEPGMRISGRVGEVAGEAELAVSLTPATPRRDRLLEAAADFRTLEAPVEDSFFELSRVPEGIYFLRLVAEGTRLAERQVHVKAGTDLELAEPLEPQEARWLEVQVVPPRGPDSRPWLIGLTRARPFGDSSIPIAREPTLEGFALFTGLEQGVYHVDVESADGQTFASRTLELTTDDGSLEIDLNLVDVSGRLTAGGEGLDAEIELQGSSGERIRSQATDGGWFELTVDAGTTWRVAVRLGESRTRLPDEVEIRRDRDGTARLDLRLPGGRVEGRVETMDGESASSAIVTLVSADGLVHQARSAADGGFALLGLRPGPARLAAEAAAALFSAVERIEVAEDQPSWVELTVREKRDLIVKVTAASRPVPGAVLRLAGVGVLPGALTGYTGPSGAAEFWIPHGTDRIELAVVSPDLPRHMIEVEIGDLVQTLEVELPVTYGELRIPASQAALAYEVSNGEAGFAVHELFSPARGGLPPAELELESGTIVLPMAAGSYRLCPPGAVGDGDCASGLLAAHGELVLQIDDTTDQPR